MKENNIILFPKLKETLTQKGMTALENQNYQEALKHFNQLLDVEPKHPQANLGKIICLIQQNRFQDAAEICEFMLDEQMTNMQEVIQVYVSVLIQLEQYKKAADLLKKTLNQENLPNIVRNYYEQMLQFCNQMISVKKETISQGEIEHYVSLLNGNSFEKQMIAAKELTKHPNEKVLDQLNQFLKDETNDPVVKTIIIQELVKEKVNATLEIQKFSKRMIINPTFIQSLENNLIIDEVKNKLSEVIESKNPTLYEFSIHMLSNLVLALFPFPLPEYEPQTIAAAIHIESAKTAGYEISIESISSIYNSNEADIKTCLNELNNIINFNFNK